MIGTSAGGVEALSRAAAGAARRACARRCSSCCTCRATGRACWSRSSQPQVRAAGARGARTRSRSRRARSTSRRPTTTCSSTTGPQLALSADEPVHFSRPSIDVLFESAADVYGARLLGIVLTGASEDGARGLAAVHRAGGVDGRAAAGHRPGAAHGRVGAEAQPGGSRAAARARSPPCCARWTTVDANVIRPCQRTRGEVPARRRPRGEPARARRRCSGATTSSCSRRAPAPRRSSCCWCTTSRSRSSTCRCRTWTASSWPS